MQVTETSSEGLSREFTIVVPAADLETKMTGRLTEIGQAVSVPGFRQGKVPLAMLKTRYGESVRGEILEQTIQDSTQSAMTERGLRPAMQPKIEIVTFEDGADLEYKLAVELMPEIELMDFAKLELERPIAEVGDEEIDSSLQRLAESRKTFAAVEDGRGAASGDQVLIDFTGRVDGETFEGGTSSDFALDLGSGTFIPGFEEQLEGVKVGDKIDVKVDFPDDYPAENLKGAAAVFEVDVKEIREAKPTPVDEEFAKGMGLDNLEALRAAIREQIEREYGQVSRARLKRTLLDRLADEHEFDVPPGMSDQEFEAIWEQIKTATNSTKTTRASPRTNCGGAIARSPIVVSVSACCFPRLDGSITSRSTRKTSTGPCQSRRGSSPARRPRFSNITRRTRRRCRSFRHRSMRKR